MDHFSRGPTPPLANDSNHWRTVLMLSLQFKSTIFCYVCTLCGLMSPHARHPLPRLGPQRLTVCMLKIGVSELSVLATCYSPLTLHRYDRCWCWCLTRTLLDQVTCPRSFMAFFAKYSCCWLALPCFPSPNPFVRISAQLCLPDTYCSRSSPLLT